MTGPDGYTVTTDYDVFDRPTRVTYPDGTYEETTYDRLDVATRRDRLGRVTRYGVDAPRRLVSTRDPAGRTIQQRWGAGGLAQLDRRQGADDDLGTGLCRAGDPGGAGGRGDGDGLHVSAAVRAAGTR